MGYTAAEFINKIETEVELNHISVEDKKTLLRDMPGILDNLKEKPRNDDVVITKTGVNLHVSCGIYERSYRNNIMRSESWFKGDKCHRDGDKPAIIVWYPNGVIETSEWLQNDELHRDGDKPAMIGYYDNGTVKVECWFNRGLANRGGDEPAVIRYGPDGNVTETEHWFKGHRLGGGF